MDMQLIRESIRLEQPLGTVKSTAVVEGEVTLPGGLREEVHVLCVEAMAVADGAEALQDRVNVTGRVIFHVLYTQGDPTKVNSLETAADFTHLCSMPGVQPRMAATARLQVSRVEAKVSGGRMTMRAEVQAEVSVLSLTPVEAGMEMGMKC